MSSSFESDVWDINFVTLETRRKCLDVLKKQWKEQFFVDLEIQVVSIKDLGTSQ